MTPEVKPALEQHYTPQQVADAWAMSHVKVREIFRNEPGVLIFGREESGKKARRYLSIRIPESVVSRVKARMAR